MNLPVGTVTFLFTDIEGSTRLWEQDHDRMRESLARHDALLRDAIESNNGFVFKTIGDAFCAAFPTASDGLSAALKAQLDMTADSETSMPVRMALHTGAVELRDNDYYGQPLSRVARLLSAGHGMQILLTQAARDLVRETLPSEITLRDLGSHRLRDLQHPETVYQLLCLGLPSDFPPLKTLSNLPNNLPRQLTSFVGREREIETVKRLLSSNLLLTLKGSGGSGKTRLALQVAADLLEDYPDGVWFVELASLTDGDLVPRGVASALAVKEEPDRSIMETLALHLQQKTALLVLDNCEHLAGSCAEMAARLLQSCLKLRILATSRQALQVRGETAWTVPTLSLPAPNAISAAGGVSSLEGYEAVRLFVDRAQSVLPSFTLTDENAGAVIQICRRLDGVPLAIELAASRVMVLSPTEIANRLDNCFKLLKRPDKTVDPRQQTLEAAIDWSYKLLSDKERVFLRRMAVFAGGCTIEAAEAICADPGMDEFEVLELLSGLVGQSLVIREEETSRFRLLETIRQYSHDRLGEHGELEPRRDLHIAYYLERAEEAEPHLRKADQKEWFDRLEVEHDNLRAALKWCVERDVRLRMASSLHRFWMVRGYMREGQSWLEGALSRAAGAPIELRAKALNSLGVMAWSVGDYATAKTRFEEALTLRREMEDPRGIAAALSNRGMIARATEDYSVARECYEESLTVYRGLEDQPGIAMVLCNLGNVHYDVNDFEVAYPLYKESLEIYEALQDDWSIAAAIHNFGLVAYRLGKYDGGGPYLRRALQINLSLLDHSSVVTSLCTIGLFIHTKWPDRAATLLGAEKDLRAKVGNTFDYYTQAYYDQCLSNLHETLGDEHLNAAWAKGANMTMEQAVEYGLEATYLLDSPI